MKELIFVRHAKSDWGIETLKDVDRFLNERGYNDAYFMSNWYSEHKSKPGMILSSTATRALSTALIFARQLEFEMKYFKLEAGIYESSASNILSLIQQQDDAKDSLMLFGHNPGFTEICNRLSENILFDNIPTCGIVSLKFEAGNWKGVNFKKGKLNYYQFPKELKIKE